MSLKELWKVVRANWLTILIIGFFAFINIYYSLSWQISLYKWLKCVEVVLLIIVVSQTKIEKVIISKALLFGLIAIFIVGILQVINGSTSGKTFFILGERAFNSSTPGIAKVTLFGKEFVRTYSFFSHPNSLAGYLGLSLCIFFWSVQKRSYNKLLVYLFVFLSLLLSLLSFSLNTYIALGCVFIFLLLQRIKDFNTPRFIRCLFIVLTFLSILSPLFSSKIHSNKSSVYERLDLITAAGEGFYKNPLIGIGMGNFVNYLPSAAINFNVSWQFQPVHNIYLLFLSENGLIISLIIFLICISTLSRNSNNTYNLYLYSGILFVLITGSFDHYWLTLQQNTLELGVAVGLLTNKYGNSRNL